MKSLRKLTPTFRLVFASLVVAAAITLLYRGASGPTSAQQSQPSPQERQFENLNAKHVPLDIKLTKEKEKAWKDLKNTNWAHDFELEITNTGQKPIYTFYLLIFFDVPTDFETQLIAPIHYGRPEISDPKSKPTADDIPIKPGESKIFKINPNNLLAWDKGYREKGWRLPTKVRIKLESLTFGDGTGLLTNEGAPYPYPRRSPETSQRNSFPSLTRGKRKALNWRAANKRSIETQPSTTHLPAAVLPVNFFSTRSDSVEAPSSVEMDECEPGCERRFSNFRVTCYGCNAQNDPYYDPEGVCTWVQHGSISCTIPETGESYLCGTQDIAICVGDLGPPPPPFPTPTPPPPPDCHSCSSDAQCSCGNLHCNYSIGFCVGNYFYGCDEHFVDDCLGNIGYIPVGTCQCSHDYGYGGGGGNYGCLWWDCSCSNWWECGSNVCMSDGYCWEMLLDPILIDVSGNGFSMTDAAHGVLFDFLSAGVKRKISWTEQQSDDAWLVLDWNKNGTVDNGSEMFSNVTPQVNPPASPIGFQALAMFDTRPFGGNGDGVIDSRDPIFRQLRLWQDLNHDGISQPSELHALPELGVESFALDYKESRRRDRWGNVFRYRAKVYGLNHRDLGRWAYDVVLLSARTSTPPIAQLLTTDIDRRVAEMKMFRTFDRHP